MFLFPFINIVKHLRRQILGLLVFGVIFTIALSQVDHKSKSQGIAFSFLTALPIGWLETATTIIVQLDVNDADIGMVYCELIAFLCLFWSLHCFFCASHSTFTELRNTKQFSVVSALLPALSSPQSSSQF
jgi:hypothetical protein